MIKHKKTKVGMGLVVGGKYTFAKKSITRSIKENISCFVEGRDEVSFEIVFVHDDTEESKEMLGLMESALADVATVHSVVVSDVDWSGKVYKEEMQISLAKMQQAMFDKARDLGVDCLLSLEADIIPPPNALRCLVDAIEFDGGYYDVAFAPYPSQGGGSFLSGFGNQRNPIFEDFTKEERKLSPEFKKKEKEFKAEAKVKPRNEEKLTELVEALREELQKCPPKGDVFELNSRGRWRRRGWFDMAYAGIGKGAMVPVDWTGMGCTLLSARALAVSDFSGYDGKGTQDLFLCYHRWGAAGLRKCAVPHALCSHVSREKNEDESQDFGKLSLLYAFHEEEGDRRGHIRFSKRDFFDI